MSSEPDRGRTSAIRERSRTAATRSRAGSPPPATSGSPATPPTGKLTKRVIFKGLGRDDHNNPSLVFRHDGHIMVFFSPHSGHHLPPPGIPKAMHYMVSLNPYSINGFGKVHTVDTNVPGGLGYTYPNPLQLAGQAVALLARRRLEPDLLLHRRRHPLGAGPRARLLRPRPAAVHEVRHRRQRQFHGIFTDGHPENWKNSLHYTRYENEALYAMNGRKLGTLRTSRCTPPSSTTSTTTQTPAVARGATTSRSPPTAGRASSTRAGSTTATPSSTPTTTARSGSAARSSRPVPGARPSTPAARPSTTRTRASSTCRARSATGTRSSSGSRRTRAARGRTAS